MHKFSAASQQSSVLTVLRSVGLLSVPYSTLAGAWGTRKRVPRLVRPALSALRHENLCIIRANWKIKLTGVGFMVLLVGGCSDLAPLESPSSTPTAPSSAGSSPTSGSVLAAGIEFQAPDGWIQEVPSSSMRAGQYRIPGVDGDQADAEMVVFHFEGAGGSVQANVDRWVGQFTNVEGDPVSDQIRSSEKDGRGIDITIVDVRGTYNESQGPMMAETTARPRYRMLAAVVEGAGGPWFFKLTGPEKTVTQSGDSFQSLLDSLQLDP